MIDLNEKQKEAINYINGPLRVIAGAGSGKTKVLTLRYINLVRIFNVNPVNILALTFTNKATIEMKERIIKELGDEYDYSYISTYHSFASHLIRDNYHLVNLPKTFRILDENMSYAIIKKIFDRNKIQYIDDMVEEMLDKIIRYKMENDYVLDMINKQIVVDEFDDFDTKIIKQYLIREKEINSLDFTDLITYCIYILKNNEEVKELYQNKFKYILVDEFQDTSSYEYEIISILSEKHNNLMVVGDPDQNIYEWRDSKVEILLNFNKDFSGTKTVIMDRNYRSSKEILDSANALIKNNKNRIEKDLYTLREDGIPVTYETFDNDESEANRIVDLILEKKEEGIDYKDIAVLYRVNYLSERIERTLSNNSIPYDIVGGMKFYKRTEILDVIALLRLVAYFDDDSFLRMVNKPSRGIGKKKIEKLTQLNEGEPLFITLINNIEDKSFYNEKIVEFSEIIQDLSMAKDDYNAYELLDKVLLLTDYEKLLSYLSDKEKFENIRTFRNIAQTFVSTNENNSIYDFLNYINTEQEKTLLNEGDEVKLMTIHASKGLEFKVVILVGLTDSIIPYKRTIEERGDVGLEEERRLMYVALTRAMDELYLFKPNYYQGTKGAQADSRFIKELKKKDGTKKIKPPKHIIENTSNTDEILDEPIVINYDKYEYHNDYKCISIIDFIANTLICERCHKGRKRYLHTYKDNKDNVISVCSECAREIDQNIDESLEREKDIKKRYKLRNIFYTKEFKESSKGNLYMKINDILFVIIEKDNKYLSSYNGQFLKESFDTIDEAKKALCSEYIKSK